PILVSLATPPAPAGPTPAVAPPTTPLARQPEPEVAPTPEVVEPPEPAAAPSPVQPAPLPQPSAAAVNPPPMATPQAPSRETTTAVNDDNPTLNTTEEPPSTTTTAAAPTSVLEAVDPAQLRSQYVKTATELVNKHKRYPRRLEYRGVEGTVRMAVVVNRHGEVLNSRVERSSGNTLLDKEALASIQRAQPFPPLSDEMAKIGKTWTMTITISFNLR
ncbi:MAG: TonB family protein, partial [Synechococcus sp. SB0673_bin_10]|nr:TonB family protein [Synechococcus sp. SB0673_bin_10]